MQSISTEYVSALPPSASGCLHGHSPSHWTRGGRVTLPTPPLWKTGWRMGQRTIRMTGRREVEWGKARIEIYSKEFKLHQLYFVLKYLQALIGCSDQIEGLHYSLYRTRVTWTISKDNLEIFKRKGFASGLAKYVWTPVECAVLAFNFTTLLRVRIWKEFNKIELHIVVNLE